jgi:molecular chaperone DnaK
MYSANLAGLGKVAIMQEPVAAVMSVMRTRKDDGAFLIFDLGGGTLDVAVAESLNQRVNLLAHGGIAMCGGRDFDRALIEKLVIPWLHSNFKLPKDLAVSSQFKSLLRLAAWATEQAKIELSSKKESVISLSETEIRVKDLDGQEIYLEIPLLRELYDSLIGERVEQTVTAALETVAQAGLRTKDLQTVVFVGGPTNYKPLRDAVCNHLDLPSDLGLNPMTAVAEGASLFAESIDWNTSNRARKSNRSVLPIDTQYQLSFAYISRTPNASAKIAVRLGDQRPIEGEFQIDSLDTGWTSGRYRIEKGATVEVRLTKNGDNAFKVSAFAQDGRPIPLPKDHIVITRTPASVDSIPASHSIAVEVLDKLGGLPLPEYLIRAGDPLPKKGQKIFKAGQALKAGAASSLNFKLWEGEIEDPLTDNRFIGVLKISGSDFFEGTIPAGATLECEYEILDSGNIILEVSVPSISSTFYSGKNFYSRQEGQPDYASSAPLVLEEAQKLKKRLFNTLVVVKDQRLTDAASRLELITSSSTQSPSIEDTQEAMETILEARRILAKVRKDNLQKFRQFELDQAVHHFNTKLRQYARTSEISSFELMVRTAKSSLDRDDRDFEHHMAELKGRNSQLLWRQDWFVEGFFNDLIKNPSLYSDQSKFKELARLGAKYCQAKKFSQLRKVVIDLLEIRIFQKPSDDFFDEANIIRS